MAGAKETPRQKMIGMMYLVLTALLALNISKEVLDAFITIDEGLKKTQTTLTQNSNSIMSEFDAKYTTNPEKVGPFYTAAQKMRDDSDDLLKWIEEMKAHVMASSQTGTKDGKGWEEYMASDTKAISMKDREKITKPDENQNNTSLLIGPNMEKPRQDPFSAFQLQSKLENYRDGIRGISFRQITGEEFKMVNPENMGLMAAIDSTFHFPMQMERDKQVEWVVKNFYHVPLAAVIAQLSKISVDVEKTKVDVLNRLIGGIEAKSYKFTNLVPLVIPKSNYILRGDTFRAEVLLAAYDATNPPKIFIGDQQRAESDSTVLNTDGLESLPINFKGLGELKIPTSGMALGETFYRGHMDYIGPSGEPVSFEFFIDPFTVAEPALVVSPTKMNVFYRGLRNPVEISVPGIPSDKLQVTCSGGHRLTKGSKGEWVVKPGKGREAVISVSATMPDGSRKSIGSKKFRVKRIPDPVPEFAKKSPSDNSVKKSDMTVAAGVIARMKNFDFEVSVKVKSFTMVFIRDGQVIEKKSNSNRVTQDMKANMKKVSKGQKIYIEKIKVTMPDGSVRPVANISLKIV